VAGTGKAEADIVGIAIASAAILPASDRLGRLAAIARASVAIQAAPAEAFVRAVATRDRGPAGSGGVAGRVAVGRVGVVVFVVAGAVPLLPDGQAGRRRIKPFDTNVITATSS
jgi:hypothetical protein